MSVPAWGSLPRCPWAGGAPWGLLDALIRDRRAKQWLHIWGLQIDLGTSLSPSASLNRLCHHQTQREKQEVSEGKQTVTGRAHTSVLRGCPLPLPEPAVSSSTATPCPHPAALTSCSTAGSRGPGGGGAVGQARTKVISRLQHCGRAQRQGLAFL